MLYNKLIVILVLSLLSYSAQSKQLLSSKIKKQISSSLSKALGQEPSLIEESPIKGLYAVLYGTRLFYVSLDGRYVFEKASMIDMKDRSDVSDKIVSKIRKGILKQIKSRDTIVYKPKGKSKHIVTVFTDIDCPYCQKLHEERQLLLDSGVEIRYLMYPRSGKGSKSYNVAKAVTCATNKPKALTIAKANAAYNSKVRRSGRGKYKQQSEKAGCDSPLDQNMEMLHELGMEAATPQILLSNGQLFRGYVPAKRLIDSIKKAK